MCTCGRASRMSQPVVTIFLLCYAYAALQADGTAVGVDKSDGDTKPKVTQDGKGQGTYGFSQLSTTRLQITDDETLDYHDPFALNVRKRRHDIRESSSLQECMCENHDGTEYVEPVGCKHAGEKFRLCRGGQKKAGFCIQDKLEPCDWCPDGTFSVMLNNCTKCHKCSTCRTDEEVIQNCTLDQDIICGCPIQIAASTTDTQTPGVTEPGTPELITNQTTTLPMETTAITTLSPISECPTLSPNCTCNCTSEQISKKLHDKDLEVERYKRILIALSSVLGFVLLIFILTCIRLWRFGKHRKMDQKPDTEMQEPKSADMEMQELKNAEKCNGSIPKPNHKKGYENGRINYGAKKDKEKRKTSDEVADCTSTNGDHKFDDEVSDKEETSNEVNERTPLVDDLEVDAEVVDKEKQHPKDTSQERKQTWSDAKQELQRNCRLHGYKIRQEIDGDGNCGFHAVCDQLERLNATNKYTHEELRNMVVEYMRETPKIKEPEYDLATNIPSDVSDVDEYCEKMSRDGEWMDDIVLIYLSDMLQRDIIVVPQCNNCQYIPRGVKPDGDNAILLGNLQNRHFESLEPITANSPDENDGAGVWDPKQLKRSVSTSVESIHIGVVYGDKKTLKGLPETIQAVIATINSKFHGEIRLDDKTKGIRREDFNKKLDEALLMRRIEQGRDYEITGDRARHAYRTIKRLSTSECPLAYYRTHAYRRQETRNDELFQENQLSQVTKNKTVQRLGPPLHEEKFKLNDCIGHEHICQEFKDFTPKTLDVPGKILDKMRDVVSAFANTCGGYVYFGVNDDGIVNGIPADKLGMTFDIFKRVQGVIRKMLWCKEGKILKPEEIIYGIHWDIRFIEVKSDEPQNLIVVEITIPRLTGGIVFVQTPEYPIVINNHVLMLEGGQWFDKAKQHLF